MLYVEAWFSAQMAIAASVGDFEFLKDLSSFPDYAIAKATSEKMMRH